MVKPNLTKLTATLFFLILSVNFLIAAKKANSVRSLEIAGLVVDAKTLLPLGSVMIYDAGNHLLATTDKNGYYDVKLSIEQSGEMIFSLKIKKGGYHQIIQNEHWGNLSDGAKSMFYFGLKKSGDNTTSFSKLVNGRLSNDLSYANVADNFSNAKAERMFDNKIAEAKAGNQNVLIQVDGAYYIADESGWIKLNSVKDSVSIDNKRVVAADELNAIVKRSDVKGMTPVNSQKAKFAIYTH